jgi:hypothetical protein
MTIERPMFPPSRRRFLAIATVGSIVGAGSLAAVAMTPNDVPQAVTVPSASPSHRLRAAIRQLAAAHETLIAAQADNEEAEAMWTDWQRIHPQPKNQRGTRKWIKKGSAYRMRVTSPSWQALMRAELVFVTAQCEVALVPITGAADLHGMAVASAKYDRVELARVNRGFIGLMVADEIAGLRKAVLS